MDQELRNKLRNVVTQSRRLLEDECRQALEGKFGIFAKKDQVTADPNAQMAHLNDEEQAARKDILDHYEHIKARGFNPKESLDQLVREIAFTHLNRLCAYKMMEARDVVLNSETDPSLRDAYGDPPRFREAVSRGIQSNGLKRYLAYHEDDERLYNTGHQDVAYRHFLDWLGGLLSEEIGVLFNPNDPANRLYPRQATLDAVLDLLNGGGIKPEEMALRERWPQIWSQDETIGWVYQYFTPKELRDEARKASQAPRNSYELAFRNQFFTPRYVVEFLTDNTLGRIWYEMRQGQTRLAEQCRYLVQQPDEVFFSRMSSPDEEFPSTQTIEAARLLREGTKETFPPFEAGDDSAQRMIEMAHTVSAYDRHGHEAFTIWNDEDGPKQAERLGELTTQQILDGLFMTCRADRHGGTGEVYAEPWFVAMANEVRRRALAVRNDDLKAQERLRLPVFVSYRAKKDPREIKLLDPACGSGHFLLYGFDLLLVIYEEAYSDPDLGPALKQDYSTLDALRRDVPRLILAHNLHGIDIDLRATQIAALALWLRCQRAYQEMGLKKDRPRITRSNFVCAEPMPGEKTLLDEFLKTLKQDRLETLIRRVMQVPKGTRVRATESMAERLTDLVQIVWEKMQLAGEAGSLLKIEEELQEAIRKGQEEWEEKQPLFRFTEFSLTEQPKESYVRLVPGEGVSFWQRAKSLVLEALRDYARHAANGGRLQKQLFADDAERGFSFIDICEKTFHVILMNPPFGEVSTTSRNYLYAAYENASQDVFSAFVDRGMALLDEDGLLGAITSRLGFFLELLESWRGRLLGGVGSLKIMADLGYGVLDDALVEAAAYTVQNRKSKTGTSVFINLLASEDKETSLAEACRSLQLNGSSPNTFAADTASFLDIPANRTAYWVSPHWRKLFKSSQRVRTTYGFPFVGFQTGDDDFFLRLHWEVPEVGLNGNPPKWVSFAKGGEYSPFYGDFHLVVDWSMKHHARRQSNSSAYFLSGVTYTERTTSNLSARILPPGCVFSPNGVTITPSEGRVLECVFLLNTRISQFLLEMCVGSGDAVHSGSAARHYGPRIVASIPTSDLNTEQRRTISQAAEVIWDRFRDYYSTQETDRYFISPFACTGVSESLKELAKAETIEWEARVVEIIRLHRAAEEAILISYGLTEQDLADLSLECGQHPDYFPERPLRDEELTDLKTVYSQAIESIIDDEVQSSGASRSVTKKTYIADRLIELLATRFQVHPMSLVEARRNCLLITPGRFRDVATRTVSYLVGLAFGRWDYAKAASLELQSLPRPNEPIPPVPPGASTDRCDSDGLIPDDPDHSDDVIRLVREALELIWKDRVEAIEKETCEILGVKELRDYFRKSGKGGFWDDHISRYSKSRRKAPIYWLVQSSKKSYALWLYYHRLDKDLLFKALTNYVEPKIRLESDRLQSLNAQKAQAGDSGKEAKRLAKEVEKQDDLLSELRDFEDKLRRAANLNLEPDLNDGVILNIAPLWELVPWKEAKACWEELLEGKYEWSSIGKQLRQKGLVT